MDSMILKRLYLFVEKIGLVKNESINERRVINEKLSLQTPLNKPRIMINVGACKGGEAIEKAREGWTTYAFEANPKNKPELQEGERLPNFHWINMAVATTNEKSINFYTSEKHPGIGSLIKWHENHEPIEVKAITLKDFYKEHKISKIDYFLIDAETMDLEIMKTHDWEVPIGMLLMEFNRRNIKEICEYILSEVPEYKHIIFEYNNPYEGCWEPGKPLASCVKMSTIEEHKRAKKGHWGNVVFYLP